ncbi:hypothetical protein BSLG_001469 [Batrachochytrium salamandrivorans]|nr:hypothetical protein BSLG_001469 [Batrachochytrium salamandrivorans]
MATAGLWGWMPTIDKLTVLGQIYSSGILLVIYKCYKRCIRLYTRSSELNRICHYAAVKNHISPILDISSDEVDNDPIKLAKDSAKRCNVDPELIQRVEHCLMYSTKLMLPRRDFEARQAMLEKPLVKILEQKQFPLNGSILTPSAIILRACMEKILRSYELMHHLNERAATKYNTVVPYNEIKLMEIWNILMPHKRLSNRYSLDWQDIGFQGQDPATDFRGMGLLSLDDLHFLCKKRPSLAARILSSSRQDASWFPFAVTSIHITDFTLRMMRTRLLQNTLYRLGIEEDVYREVYCYFFDGFEKYWLSQKEPPKAIHFEQLFKEYQIKAERELFEMRIPVLEYSGLVANRKKDD